MNFSSFALPIPTATESLASHEMSQELRAGFYLTLLIERGMPILNTTETRYGKYVNQQIPGESR
jgi:hypothetical protein